MIKDPRSKPLAKPNVLCAGSGYLAQGDMYRMGGLVTLTNLLIFPAVGTPWILLVVM